MKFPASLPARMLAVLLACVTATAATATGMPLVAELFTSQGCSSCPPADALLGELAREPDVIALAFHVQYWDGLGWADRFGMPEAQKRQQAYVQLLRSCGGFHHQPPHPVIAQILCGTLPKLCGRRRLQSCRQLSYQFEAARFALGRTQHAEVILVVLLCLAQ